jgi:hypothetical protein
MARLVRVAAPLIVLTALSSAAAAARCPYTPAIGSAERKAIMDAIRGPVEAELKQNVRFVAKQFTVCGNWAFLEAEPEQADGRAIDWSVTDYAGTAREGICGGYVHALLVRDAGHWRVREKIVCASDVPYVEWPREFGAPAALFPRLD